MKRKFISEGEYRKNIQPAEKLIFSEQSLVQGVTLPPRTVFNALHGNLRVQGAQGTLYVVRRDDDPLPLNVDEYSFNSNQTGSIEIVGPLKPEYHWAPDVPEHIKKQMPQSLKDKVSKAIDRSSHTHKK